MKLEPLTTTELQNLKKELAEQYCIEKFNYKGYDCYILDAVIYNLTIYVYDNNTLIYYYIQSNLNIKSNNNDTIIKKLKQKMKTQIFNDNDMSKPLKSYQEYFNKWLYLLNICTKKFNTVYYAYIDEGKNQKIKKLNYYCDFCYNYFDNEKDFNYYNGLVKTLKNSETKALKDEKYLYDACIWEFYNYECMYSNRFKEVIYNIFEDRSITKEQRAIIDKAITDFKDKNVY